MISLLDFPTEILDLIGRSLESQADINALLQTNRRLYQILSTYLYKFNANFFTGSALLWAVRNHQPQTAHYALQNGVEELLDWDREPLHCAAENGDTAMISLLLQYDAGVDCRKLDKTPLYVAAARGHEDVVGLLLQNGAYLESNNFEPKEDPSSIIYNTRYNTPLHIAAYNGHTEVVKLLLEKGADIKAENSNRATPLKQALSRSHYGILWLLIDSGTSEQRRRNSEMMLHEAAFAGHIEMVRGLLDRGIDPNLRDDEGYSILTNAAADGNREVVDLLVERGADFEAKNLDGNTALGTCAYFDREASLEILLDYGADPNCRNSGGNTPLHLVLSRKTARFLLARGAILDAMNDDGQTPLSRAAEMQNDDLELFFLRYIAGRDEPSPPALDSDCVLA